MKKKKERKILVFDITGATDKELKEIKKEIRILADIVVQEAYEIMRDGKFYGCIHDHIAIAMDSYRADHPCEDCDSDLPGKEAQH